jgi:predicted transcriptional regulator
MTAREAMTTEPAALQADAPLSDVAKLMLERRIHRILIEEDGETIGIVTSRDLMRAIREKKLNHPLSRYMSAPLFTVRATEPVSLATERLEKAGVTGLVVVDDEYPVGVFTQFEALDARDVRRETAVEEVMNVAILLLRSDMPIYRAAAQAAAMEVRRIVAMEYSKAVGIVTGFDFARVVA